MITVRAIRPGEAALLSSAVKHDPLLHEARAQLQREGRGIYARSRGFDRIFEIPGAAGGGKPDLCTAVVEELAP